MTSPTEQLIDAAQGEATTAGPLVVGGIVGIGVVAFGIKALWVAWRGGSKALGKTGT